MAKLPCPQPERTTRVTFHTFEDVNEAIEFRRINGTGGWIVQNMDKGSGVLFPHGWTASQVMSHTLADCQHSKLIA
jgi:hypothetical protein